jgi:hypothetical protein
MIPIISTAFIDEHGRRLVLFDLLERMDGTCQTVASVSFCDGEVKQSRVVNRLSHRGGGILRLARRYEARAVCQVFRREVMP